MTQPPEFPQTGAYPEASQATTALVLGIIGLFFAILAPVAWVIAIFSLAFFGQQSWSTLVMVLPTDLVPREALGKVAGLVGLGGAMGGVVLGQLAGWLLDHSFSYTPVLIIAGSLHVIAFLLICLVVPAIKQLNFSKQTA